MVDAVGEEEQEMAAEMAASFLSEDLPESVFGAPKAGVGMWASKITVMNSASLKELDEIRLEQNEAAFR